MKHLLKKIKIKVNFQVSNLRLGEINIATQPFWKIRLLAIFLLLAIAGLFKFIPIVEQARYTIPPEIFTSVSEKYNCQYILDSRPWYSTFNYGLWMWIIIVPLLISFIKITMPKWQKIMLTLFTIGVCHLLFIFNVILAWNITNDVFMIGQGAFDVDFINDCVNTNDGSALAGAVFLGWIYTSFYVGLCFFVRWIFRVFRNRSFLKW